MAKIEKRTVITMEDKVNRVKIINGGKAVEIFSVSDCDENAEKTNKEGIKGTNEYIEKYFPIVKASTISLEDEFLKHEPETNCQKKFKKMLIDAIESGLSDFRAQRMDASFDEEGNLCYKSGMKPAVGKSAKWWYEKAKEFMPEKNSRLGTTKQRIAFLGLLIKYLIDERGYRISNAWKAVCDQSRDLGHYLDSEDAKYEFELTGCRQLGEWCDLANTCKITIDKEPCDFFLFVEDRFSSFGGYYNNDGFHWPLVSVNKICYPNYDCSSGTGWLVLSV